jgi:ribosomal-protein-serine acetyltransferase
MTPGGAPATFAIGLDERCHLRLYEENDVDELYALVVANRDMLARWMPWAPTLTREDTAEFIRRSRRQWAANEGFQAAIVDGGALAGTIGFGSLHWPNRSVSVGYWLGAAGQGRGTMTRSVAALVRYAFEVYGLNRVEIRVGTENGRSRAIPERLGFSHEGTLRCAEWVNERFINHEVYALLVDEWRPSRAGRS